MGGAGAGLAARPSWTVDGGRRHFIPRPLPVPAVAGNNRPLFRVYRDMAMGIDRLFGRDPALRREIERSRGLLARMAYAWTHDRDLADDLAQSAVEKALRNAGQLRDAARVKAWLLQILANCLRDHVRARREHVDLDSMVESMASGDATPEEAQASAQLVRRVREAVARLPLGQRQVVTLVDLEECTYAEAGEILEIPIGTVMSRLCRARRALREELEPMAQDAPGTRLRSVK